MFARGVALTLCAALASAAPAAASPAQRAAMAFAAHCFSPFLTATRAAQVLASEGVRVDFHDLDPLGDVPPSPVTGRAATPGTDRRCEVAVSGHAVETGIAAVRDGLAREGIDRAVETPATFPAQPGHAFIAARQLNPQRIAVVQVGTRPGPEGIETYVNVERLVPRGEVSP